MPKQDFTQNSNNPFAKNDGESVVDSSWMSQDSSIFGAAPPPPRHIVVQQENDELRAQIAELEQQITTFQSHGEVVVNGFQLTKLGLFIPDAANRDDWDVVGDVLFRLHDSIQLLIGDYLVGMEREYGITYKDFAEKTGRSVKTLRNYCYVAGNVEMSLRRDNLDYSHYMLVAAMKPRDQKKWLERASQHGWSKRELEAQIKQSQSKAQHNALPTGDDWLFGREQKPNIGQIQTLWARARHGDQSAAENLQQHLQAVESWIQAVRDSLHSDE